MTFETVRKELLELHENVGSPASAELLHRFEVRFQVSLPAEVKTNYAIMNGSEGWTDGHKSWMRFWPIEEWQLVHATLPKDAVAKSCPGSCFVIADYAIECVYYVIDLKLESPSFGHVFAIGGTRLGLVAQGFREFVEKVLADSDDLHCYG